MARRGMALVVRMLLSLALVVAAAPLKAGVSARAGLESGVRMRAEARAPGACGMACCEKKAMVACMREPAAKVAAPCKCELKPGPALPVAATKAVAPVVAFALAPSPPAVAAHAIVRIEPGVVGADSGPPRPPDRRSDPSRAPPVVRV